MEKSRRARGEGTIYRRADGRWEAQVTVGYRNGKRSRKCIYGKTKREVAKKIRVVLSAQDKGQAIGTRSQSLEQFLHWWLKDVKKGSVRSSTFDGYESKIRLHINPELGRIRLDKLTTQQVQSFLTMKLQSGLAPAMVRSLRVVLVSALTKAHALDLVPKNVAAFSAAPHLPKTKVDPFDVAETQCFLEAMKGEPLEALFVVAVTAGLRRGELLGIQWGNVDLDKGLIQVRQSLQRVDTKLQLVPTKSGRARNVSLTSLAVVALKRHRSLQLERRFAAGERWSNDLDLVFTGRMGGPLEATIPNRIMTRVLKKAAIRHRTFHTLRHTVGTRMMALGVNPKIVAEMLGHSNVMVTLDLYSHVSPTMQSDAAEKMDAVLGAAR
jgi:integrase